MKKKRAVQKTACRLFAGQGVEATPTLQISRGARAAEPLIFNHLKPRDPGCLYADRFALLRERLLAYLTGCGTVGSIYARKAQMRQKGTGDGPVLQDT